MACWPYEQSLAQREELFSGTNSPPQPLGSPLLSHHLPQKQVNPGLIASAGRLEPSKNICIQTHGYTFFLRPVESSNHSARWEVPDLWNVRQINFRIRPLPKPPQFHSFFIC